MKTAEVAALSRVLEELEPRAAHRVAALPAVENPALVAAAWAAAAVLVVQAAAVPAGLTVPVGAAPSPDLAKLVLALLVDLEFVVP